jgi:hypothetical protein
LSRRWPVIAIHPAHLRYKPPADGRPFVTIAPGGAWAQRIGDDGLVEELKAVGPPHYEAMFHNETALSYEPDVYAYDYSANSEGAGQMSENMLVDEYTLVDQIHILGAFMDTFAALYPHLQDVDFRKTATDADADGWARPFAHWYPMIDAPIKQLVAFGTSGHRPLWEQPQPDQFVEHRVAPFSPRRRRIERSFSDTRRYRQQIAGAVRASAAAEFVSGHRVLCALLWWDTGVGGRDPMRALLAAVRVGCCALADTLSCSVQGGAGL